VIRYVEAMGYAMLHEYGANTETPFFTPTGPLFCALLADCLPFAVRYARCCVRILYQPPSVPTPHAPYTRM